MIRKKQIESDSIIFIFNKLKEKYTDFKRIEFLSNKNQVLANHLEEKFFNFESLIDL